MDEILNRIREDISDILVSQARTEENLQEHMRRTALAEKSIASIAKQVQPIQEHVAMVKGAGKLVGVLGAAVALLLGILQLAGKL